MRSILILLLAAVSISAATHDIAYPAARDVRLQADGRRLLGREEDGGGAIINSSILKQGLR